MGLSFKVSLCAQDHFLVPTGSSRAAHCCSTLHRMNGAVAVVLGHFGRNMGLGVWADEGPGGGGGRLGAVVCCAAVPGQGMLCGRETRIVGTATPALVRVPGGFVCQYAGLCTRETVRSTHGSF